MLTCLCISITIFTHTFIVRLTSQTLAHTRRMCKFCVIEGLVCKRYIYDSIIGILPFRAVFRDKSLRWLVVCVLRIFFINYMTPLLYGCHHCHGRVPVAKEVCYINKFVAALCARVRLVPTVRGTLSWLRTPNFNNPMCTLINPFVACRTIIMT